MSTTGTIGLADNEWFGTGGDFNYYHSSGHLQAVRIGSRRMLHASRAE